MDAGRGKQLRRALAWNATHAGAKARSVLVYAWNEFAEGGWICPTLQGGTDRILAIKSALDVTYEPAAPNLALAASATSSSVWDDTQTADKAFDGNPGSWWQASPGSVFADQWLEVDFGGDTSFDTCVISEYGDRTRGFRIDFWDGASWQTAFAGTTIGDSRTITFPRVTGRKARLVFTQGIWTPIVFELAIYDR